MSALFTPIGLRGLTLPNRVWLSPMCQYAVERGDGVPTDWQLVHLGARAMGGFGLVFTEATAVLPEGRISAQDTGLWDDEQAAGWSRIVDFVHGRGTAIGVQLAHAGRKASTYRAFPGEPSGGHDPAAGGWVPVGPTTEAFPGLLVPHALTVAEIQGVVAGFAAAARRADEVGFDVVELHAAHGYLLHEFLSPLTNLRRDEYGGDLHARTRIVREVVSAIRAVWPDHKPLVLRISGSDWLDGGWDAAQSTELARQVAPLGVDLVDVSSGGLLPASVPVGPGYQVPLAEAVRGSGLPVGAVGLITEPRQAEEIVAAGRADVVLLARAALREPAWPQRAAAELGVPPDRAGYPTHYLRGVWPVRD